jgi:hypothetical protein
MEYAGMIRDTLHLNSEQNITHLHQLSRDYPGTNSSSHAHDLLCDSFFNPLLNIEMQEDAYHADMKRYLFFGQRPLEEQVYLVSGGVAQSPGSPMIDIGIFFFLDFGFRSLDCLFGNPIQRDDIIKALCFYERKFPENPQLTSLRERISILYARKRDYNRALTFAQMAGSLPSGRIKKLSDKKAEGIYYMILEDPDCERKIRNLSRLIFLYPNAPILKRADKSLDKFIEEDLYEFRLSRKNLMSRPVLWDKAILDLDPDLLDGKRENGEMSREGIVAIKEGPVFYTMEGEIVIREIPLTPEIRQLVNSEIRFQGLGDDNKITGEKRKERPFPLEISGGVGTGGWEVYPSFVPVPYTDDDMDLFR